MKCKGCKKRTDCNLDEIRIVPFEIEDEELHKLFSYFLHTAPGIDSAHKTHLSPDLHDKVYKEMMEGRQIEVQKYYSDSLADKLMRYKLLGSEICLPCKRIICQRKNNKDERERKETDLECLLRHLRNAIAHGRVYYYQQEGKRKWLVFEDINKSKNLSARIVCLKADLKQWKKVLGKHVMKSQHS